MGCSILASASLTLLAALCMTLTLFSQPSEVSANQCGTPPPKPLPAGHHDHGSGSAHSLGDTYPVRLEHPKAVGETIMWTQSRDLGDGHTTIRMASNIHLILDAYHGDSGRVRDGTPIFTWEWNGGDNQRW